MSLFDFEEEQVGSGLFDFQQEQVTTQNTESFISGESRFEQFLDILNTPQQMMLGAIDAQPGESLWDSMNRGARSNLTFKDLTGESVVSTPLQFVIDPMNLVPFSWGAKAMKGLGKVTGVAKGAAWVGDKLGEYETFRKVAKAFNKNAYESVSGRKAIHMTEVAKDKLDVESFDLMKSITDNEIKFTDEAIQRGKELGYDEETVRDMVRQMAEYKQPHSGLPTGIVGSKTEEKFRTLEAATTTIKPLLDDLQIPHTFQKELSLPSGARQVFSESVVKNIRNIEGIAEGIPVKIPSFVTKAALAANKRMEDVLFMEQRLGVGTPELNDVYNDYLLHMLTPEAKKAIGAAFEPKYGYRKFSPVHQSMLARELRGLSIDEINKMASEGTLQIGGKTIKVSKFMEDSVESLAYFRGMRALRIKTNIDMINDAAEWAALDAKTIRNGLIQARNAKLKAAQDFEDSLTGMLGDVPEQRPGLYFHGTGSDLSIESLDPQFGNHESLFGHGIYVTNDPSVAYSYAAKRGKKTSPKVYGLDINIPNEAMLDMTQPATPVIKQIISKAGQWSGEYSDNLKAALTKPDVSSEELFKALRKDFSEYSNMESIPTSEFVEAFQDIVTDLTENGIRALKYQGGVRTGNKLHEALVLLDPQSSIRKMSEVPYNPAKITPDEFDAAMRKYDLENNITQMPLLDDEVRKAIPEGYERLSFVNKTDSPLYKDLIPYFEDKWFEPDVAKHLNGMVEYNVNPVAMGGLMEFMEKFRQNWVIGTLFGYPSTIFKNLVGNVHNAHLEGLNAKNIGWYDVMRKTTKAMNSGNGGLELTLPSGEVKKAADLWHELRSMSVTGTGYAPEVMRFKSKLFDEPAIYKYGSKIPLVGKAATKWMKLGQKWYQDVEDTGRGALYLFKKYGEKMGEWEARAIVKKNLFDYVHGLTDFERKLRLYVPFYPWLRFNLPLQVRSLVENPIRPTYVRLAEIAAVMRDKEVQGDVDDFHKTVLPDFIRDQVGIPVGRDANGNPKYFMFGNWVPAAELESLRKPLNKIINSFAPYFKIPIEQAFNYDLYLQRPIEAFPGETQPVLGGRLDVSRRLMHYAKLFRFVNEINNLAGGAINRELTAEQEELWRVASRMMFGGGTVPVNLEYGERKRQKKINEIIGRLKYEESDADVETMLEYLNELTE